MGHVGILVRGARLRRFRWVSLRTYSTLCVLSRAADVGGLEAEESASCNQMSAVKMESQFSIAMFTLK